MPTKELCSRHFARFEFLIHAFLPGFGDEVFVGSMGRGCRYSPAGHMIYDDLVRSL